MMNFGVRLYNIFPSIMGEKQIEIIVKPYLNEFNELILINILVVASNGNKLLSKLSLHFPR